MKADALRLQSLRVPGNFAFNYRFARQDEDFVAAPTSLNAFNDEHVRFGCRVTELARLAILFAVQPLFRAIDRWKFEDNDTFWFPIAFENFGFAATNDVFAAVLVNGSCGLLFVFLVTNRISDFDLDDDVRRHKKELIRKVGNQEAEKRSANYADD